MKLAMAWDSLEVRISSMALDSSVQPTRRMRTINSPKQLILLPCWIYPTVLKHWEGLGYYSRANRIYQSSKILVELVGKNIDQDPHSCPLQNFCVAHTKYDPYNFPKKNDQNKASSRNWYWSCF